MTKARVLLAIFRIVVVNDFYLGIIIARHGEKYDVAGALVALEAPDFDHAHLATIKIQRLIKILNAHGRVKVFHVHEARLGLRKAFLLLAYVISSRRGNPAHFAIFEALDCGLQDIMRFASARAEVGKLLQIDQSGVLVPHLEVQLALIL